MVFRNSPVGGFACISLHILFFIIALKCHWKKQRKETLFKGRLRSCRRHSILNSLFSHILTRRFVHKRLTKERPEKKNICFAILSWRRNAKYAFIMLLRVCCEILEPCRVTTYPQQICCACSIKVASSPSTLRKENDCFANTIFIPKRQGETFALDVSTISPCLNSDRGYTVSPALLSLLSYDQCDRTYQLV